MITRRADRGYGTTAMSVNKKCIAWYLNRRIVGHISNQSHTALGSCWKQGIMYGSSCFSRPDVVVREIDEVTCWLADCPTDPPPDGPTQPPTHPFILTRRDGSTEEAAPAASGAHALQASGSALAEKAVQTTGAMRRRAVRSTRRARRPQHASSSRLAARLGKVH